ncbi:hypothetical protein [Flagellimonas sp.]|uniref:hypothetical protein n=1 Tax=Flagellimonas sp. TaxID=2058762 RepID=UPI003B5C0150
MAYKIDFSTLSDFAFAISSPENFDTITEWMDNRFTGLPLFHKSVHLKVRRYHKIIASEGNKLALPEFIYKMASPHLSDCLDILLKYIQREEGIKNFGLLYLSVKLMPHLLKQEINRYKTHGRSISDLVTWMGTQIEVPIVLAVASRKTETYYESLAIGLRGIDSYASALTLCPSEHSNEYLMHAGLNVHASLKYLDHIIPKFATATHCKLLPEGFFSRYIRNYLIPERQDIVRTLCEYVFNGCRKKEHFSYPSKIQLLHANNAMHCC